MDGWMNIDRIMTSKSESEEWDSGHDEVTRTL